MFKQRPWRGGLDALLFLLLFLLSLPFKAVGEVADKCLEEALEFQEMAQSLENKVLKLLDPLSTESGEYKITVEEIKLTKQNDPKSYYDKAATIWHDISNQSLHKSMEIFWDSKKTGMLPGPEEALIRALLQHKNEWQNILARFEGLTIDQKQYYRGRLQFSATSIDKIPLRRGIAEIFLDVQKQQTKISASVIKGDANILPSAMVQRNFQAIIGPTGYIYLRQEEGVPTRIPDNQQHFCRNPQNNWVLQNSREWEERCLPLFDNSEWHGFSYNLLPSSYEPFLKD